MVSQVQSEIGLAFSDKKRCYWTSLKQFFAHFSTVFSSLIGMHVMQKSYLLSSLILTLKRTGTGLGQKTLRYIICTEVHISENKKFFGSMPSVCFDA